MGAVVVDTKLKYLDQWNGNRRALAAQYNEKLQGVGDLVLPKTPAETVPVWHLYVVRTAKRDELLQFLNKGGIGAGIHYPIPIHELGAYKDEMAGCASKFPETSLNAKKIL